MKVSTEGASFPVLLFVLFLILKLTETVTWSWFWVTCPLWIGLAFVFGIVVSGLLIGFLAVLLSSK
jgi:hypothetical protein